MRRILCIGDSCADILLPYGSAKAGGESAPSFIPGGTVANTASGLGHLGCDCAFLGKSGNDYFGKSLYASLQRDSVDTSYYTLEQQLCSTMILVVLDETGDRFPFLMPREKPSHLELYPQDFPDGLETRFDIVHTSGLMLFENPAADSICGFFERCHAQDMQVCIDLNFRVETVGKDDRYLRRAIDCATVLFGSGEEELCPLTGLADPEAAARSLVTDRRIVVSRLGAKGAKVYTKAEEALCPGFQVPVKDTLGAGDTYNSGFLFALVQNWELAVANICGCAAAALNLTKSGARNCPSREALTGFLQQNGICLPNS